MYQSAEFIKCQVDWLEISFWCTMVTIISIVNNRLKKIGRGGD